MTEIVQDEQRGLGLYDGSDLSPIKSLTSEALDRWIGPPCASLLLRVRPRNLKKNC